MLYQEDYSKRKRLREQSPFLSTRKNIYNQRVDSNVTKQFHKIHGNEIKTVSHQTHMSDEEGFKKPTIALIDMINIETNYLWQELSISQQTI